MVSVGPCHRGDPDHRLPGRRVQRRRLRSPGTAGRGQRLQRRAPALEPGGGQWPGQRPGPLARRPQHGSRRARSTRSTVPATPASGSAKSTPAPGPSFPSRSTTLSATAKHPQNQPAAGSLPWPATASTSMVPARRRLPAGQHAAGVLSVKWSDDSTTWIEDCHGGYYSVAPIGDVIYAGGPRPLLRQRRRLPADGP